MVNANYLYAYAIAAQLENYFPDDNMASLHQFIKYGNAKSWKDLLKVATGEELNINYLINSYKKEPLTQRQ
jgi:Zn-dependent M32 family carboxypeptidase